MTIRSVLWITASLALLAFAGCGETDDPPIWPPLPAPIPFPDTPDKLIDNFQAVYAGMDIASYRDAVLADTYEFILDDETVEEFELPDSVFDLDEELAIAESMFTGQANSEGKVLTSIGIEAFLPDGTWNPVPPSDPYFGDVADVRSRMYSVRISFYVQGGFRYLVEGRQIFYVVAEEVMHEGVLTTRYRLRGQRDLTLFLKEGASETMVWGEVKAIYQ